MSANNSIITVSNQTEQSNGLARPGVSLMRTDLELPDGLGFNDWVALGEELRRSDGSLMWWLGDWLRFGNQKSGEKYKQAVEELGFDYQTAQNAAWVARSFEISRRRENLPWGHHAEVAGLVPADGDKLRHQRNGWTAWGNQLSDS